MSGPRSRLSKKMLEKVARDAFLCQRIQMLIFEELDKDPYLRSFVRLGFDIMQEVRDEDSRIKGA